MKFFLFLSGTLFFIFHHTLVRIIVWNEEIRLKYFLRSISLTSKFGLSILNIKPEFKKDEWSKEPALYISNHLSYLDVLVLFSKYPSLFITSIEMRDIFFLGHITSLAGCFHVERRKSLRSEELKVRELTEMKEKLARGLSLFLFPEGTTSNGEKVLTFKAHFFQLAIDAQIPIKPICIKYENKKTSWYGEMTFPSHLLQMCKLQKIEILVKELPLVRPFTQDRFVLAKYCQEKVEIAYESN